jgi:hypothetical protein
MTGPATTNGGTETIPPARTVRYHERHGWHWWTDSAGAIVVCGANEAACRAALHGAGYEELVWTAETGGTDCG